MDNDGETSGKNGSWGKCPSLGLRAPAANFTGNRTGSGAIAIPTLGLDTQPWITYQASRGERPPTPAQSECSVGGRALRTPPPPPPPACISIPSRKNCRMVVLSCLSLLQLSQVSHPYGEGAMCKAGSPQGWRLERRLPMAAPGWGTPLPPFLREPRLISHLHSSPVREERGPGAPQGETLGPCEFVRPAQVRGQGLGQRLV